MVEVGDGVVGTQQGEAAGWGFRPPVDPCALSGPLLHCLEAKSTGGCRVDSVRTALITSKSEEANACYTVSIQNFCSVNGHITSKSLTSVVSSIIGKK